MFVIWIQEENIKEIVVATISKIENHVRNDMKKNGLENKIREELKRI